MRILADENIPYLTEAFKALGTVTPIHGRDITPEALAATDLLLVRSITKVNEALLAHSPVRFVASATAGIDHVDQDYLRSAGIAFAYAPGSNANSVSEYVTAALLHLCTKNNFNLTEKSLGIVGHGHVGRLVAEKAVAIGMRTVINDPPLARATGDPRYRPWEEILACDIVTFHVPLTGEGPDATHHLVDEALLAGLKSNAILINTARGPVADGAAVRKALDSGQLSACVLDVWEGEPEVDLELLNRVDIATPHIAGYSFDGKVLGTRMIYKAACEFLDVPPTWDPAPVLPTPDCPQIDLNPQQENVLHKTVQQVYDIMSDDKRTRKLSTTPEPERGKFFDALRKNYPRRREFANTRVRLENQDPLLGDQLNGLGFQT